MFKTILIAVSITLIFSTFSLHSADSLQKSNWKKGSSVLMNFSQVSLTNWTGGGKNTIALNGLLSMFGDYSGNVSNWSNTIELGYGLTKLGDETFRKSDDKFFIISKYGYKATKHLNYSALLDFRTQFNYGYNFDRLDSNNNYQKISALMSPAFVSLAIGMSYKPADYLQIMLSPISNRLIVVLDDELSQAGAFGVDKGKNIKSELGSSMNIIFQNEIFKNVNVQSRLNLFSAFSHFSSAVVNWETVVNMKINSFLSAGLTADLVYDEKVKVIRDNGTVGPATQFRNVLSLGLSYSIGNKR